MAKVDVGDPAPDFELPGTGGKTYRLSDYRGRNVVLAFYPGDATTVCTKQFCSYRDEGDRLDELDAEVLGISPQSVDSHERWAEEQRLNVPLLADEDLAVARATASPAGSGRWPAHRAGDVAGGRYVMRAIFVIDGEGVVRHRKRLADRRSPTSRSTDLERARRRARLMAGSRGGSVRGRRRHRRCAAKRRGRGRRSSSATGSRRPGATSSTARGPWSGPATR